MKNEKKLGAIPKKVQREGRQSRLVTRKNEGTPQRRPKTGV